jgi:hypothetical protein
VTWFYAISKAVGAFDPTQMIEPSGCVFVANGVTFYGYPTLAQAPNTALFNPTQLGHVAPRMTQLMKDTKGV